jgi:hypothetical protein
MHLAAALATLIRKNSPRKPLRRFEVYCLSVLCLLALVSRSVSAQTSYIPIFPKYKVLGVVYAPPGSASFVTYSNTALVGSASSMTLMNSSSSGTSTSTTSGGFLGLFGGSSTQTWSDGWSTTQEYTSGVAVNTTQGNAISTMGPISSALGVNHDNDIIYIWLNPAISENVTSYNGTTSPPTVSLSWFGLSSNGCDLMDPPSIGTFYQAASGCDPNQFPSPDIIGIPVWCLKNPYWPGQGCAQWLPYTRRTWDQALWTNFDGSIIPGLTLQDYADILQADPFVALNGSAISVCHPTYGPDLDPNVPETIALPLGSSGGQAIPVGRTNYVGAIPQICGTVGTVMNRFQPYGTVEYPMPGPDGLPQTYTGKFQYQNTNTSNTTAIDTHTTSYSKNTTVSFGTSFSYYVPIAGFNLATSNGTSNSQTWQHTNSITSTTTLTGEADYSITGPQTSDNYTGPATFNVYLDNVYGTYAFFSDLEPTPVLGTIGVGSLSSFGTVTVTVDPVTGNPLAASAPQEVILTNNSQYPLTVVSPAVTFNDPGFQIVPNDANHPDNCSNQFLPAYGTTGNNPLNPSLKVYQCDVWVEFAPVVSDAPNTLNGTSYPVNAQVIAAGTENVSYPQTYLNILVTNQAAVTGTAVTGSITHGATLRSATIPDSTQPNAYVFAQSTFTAQTEPYTFKNYYSSNVVFPTFPNDLALTDSVNFAILNDTATGGCSGATVVPGGTCSFTLQYLPINPAPASGLFNTRITAMGAVNWPTGTTGTIPLAYAGAAGTELVSLSFSPTTLSFSAVNGGEQSLAITVTNKTAYTINTLAPTAMYDHPYYDLIGWMHGSSFSGLQGNCPIPTGSNGWDTNLGPGASCTPVMNYVPLEVGGPWSGVITFTGTLSNPAATKISGTVPFTAGATASMVGKLTVSGVEQSKTVTIPATYATGEVTVKGAVSTPFTGLRHMEVNVGGFTAEAYYGKAATDATVAKALSAKLNVSGSPVKASVSGNALTLTSRSAGTIGNLPFTTTGTRDFGFAPKTGSMTGGADAQTSTKYDAGSVAATVGTATGTTKWGKASSRKSIATALANALNAASGGAFTASATNNIVTIIPNGNSPSPSITVVVQDTGGFSPASFAATN